MSHFWPILAKNSPGPADEFPNSDSRKSADFGPEMGKIAKIRCGEQ
jgi:hypothetical protein